MNNEDKKRQQNLSEILNNVDLGDIIEVHFIITQGKKFTIESDYIKKLALYICEKKGKKEFLPEELREIYEYVKKYLITNTDPTLRKAIEDIIGEFVKKGGIIKFLTEEEVARIKKLGGNTYGSIIYRNLIPYAFGIILMFWAFTQKYGSGEGIFILMFLWGWFGCMILYFIYTVIVFIYHNRQIHTVKRLIFETIIFIVSYSLLLYYTFYFLEDFIGF